MKSMHLPVKVLLSLAAILLVEGVLNQGLTQTRYSVNTVGYSDADFVAGSNLVANPLNAGNNALSNLFAGVPSGSFFVPWDRSSQAFGPRNQFSAKTGWTDGAATLRRPDGGFLWLPDPKKISFVGEPWPSLIANIANPGDACTTYPRGESVSGVLPLYFCGFCANFADCVFNPPEGTAVLKWDRQDQQFVLYQYFAEFGWSSDQGFPAALSLAPDEAALFNVPMAFTAKDRAIGYLGLLPPVQLFNPSREGANFNFQFHSKSGVDYSVQRASSLNSDSWRTILTERASLADGVVKVTVPAGPGEVAFYRVDALRLLNPFRTGNQFQFHFYTEEGVRYQVSRSASFGGPWIPMLSIDGTGALMTATDTSATSPTAYYRVEY